MQVNVYENGLSNVLNRAWRLCGATVSVSNSVYRLSYSVIIISKKQLMRTESAHTCPRKSYIQCVAIHLPYLQSVRSMKYGVS